MQLIRNQRLSTQESHDLEDSGTEYNMNLVTVALTVNHRIISEPRDNKQQKK